jgi:hypothetical protein
MNNEINYKWFLPPRKGVSTGNANQKGWGELKFPLRDLAKDIDIDIETSKQAITADKDEIVAAIPSIWGEPINFGIALFDGNHPLHSIIKDEWLGLLGLFCFNNILNLNVEIKDVDISSKDYDNGIFIEALRSLMPNNRWARIYLISVDGKVIGGTSPITLFFTSRKYQCPQIIPWQNNNRQLISPLEYYKQRNNKGYSDLFASWINEVRKELRLNQSEIYMEKSDLHNLIGLLNIPSKEKAISLSQQPLIAETPYSIVSKAIESTEEITSDILLEATKGEKPILVHSELWKNDYIVFGGRHTNAVSLPTENKGDSLCDGAIKYPWINPEKVFFTEKLLKVEISEESNRCFLKENKDTYILPLTSEILDYFKPEDIHHFHANRGIGISIFPSSEKDGSKIITLDLPISFGKRISIKKSYGGNDIIEKLGHKTPLLEIWPNFVADTDNKWNNYCNSSDPPMKSVKKQ